MHTSTICLVMLSAAAGLVSSRPSASYLTHTFRTLSSASYKRQSSVPSQCTPVCDPVNAEVNSGCPITACCTQSFETSYYNCLLCVGTAMNATDYTQAQSDLDTLYLSCYDYGYTLQELTLPGQNPSRTLSTSLPVSSSTTATSVSATATSVSATATSVSATATTVSATATTVSATATTVSASTVLSSSTSPASSGTATSPASSGTLTSPTSSSATPSSTTTSAALRLGTGGGVWALAAAAVGLLVL
ncbi:uncharacterized protein EDB91DRAFT_372965 [Suillus paluster]|uniref:uncharacterized protein n=1 Tax=Suillus paluster TaxID=48578 RepID=UPI001B87AE7F|nr:uncharacterized protein EDB91DRAFT_372965 [Suillus paluster]KAG1739904.1 hypothetical protein EDB91DRAFT_372965 [Suillus paluster]